MRNVLAWTAILIAIGCGNDRAPTGDDADAGETEPPAVYVAKVKTILVGLPPTRDEVAAVEADPAALRGLVDGWMTLPEYQQKMRVFFELAFQQTQLRATDFVPMIPNNGLLNGVGVSMLIQNVSESFARTVLQLVAEGRPLTDAFTTERLMMTPALMSLYALLDTRTVDNAGDVRDRFAAANPGLRITLRTAGGPIPISETLDPASPNYMHWYTPDLPTANYPEPSCAGQDPITFNGNSLELVHMLLGTIPTHVSPTGERCGNRVGANMQFAREDFTTWKMVTIRKPTSGEPTTAFFDFPTLRSTSELVSRTPRRGFFSTPAFFANWASNASNQHRVTLNQALIVATGAQIDGTDATTPASTPGLDTTHATGACVGCHQLLDPTRSIFSATYSWFGSPQTDAALIAQPGQFAFQGVIAPMATLEDFGRLLASHPLVAEAWVQKLCYYVSSAPCDPTDPETVRIVDSFRGSNFAWNALVRDLVSSPLTTHATASATRTEVIAVVRRDHLCAAIDNRLGLVDICQLDATFSRRVRQTTIGAIVGGLPSDGYGRGSTVAVLPNDPTLFYRAGLENICGELAAMVVDGSPDADQPSKKQWSSSQPDAAIADFVA
ncbi:MAG: hypothetical protein H0V17_05460, partial [Deltaproteobacteria bacterium]|nr:hypothetical protein [Deltaproteobacteria bacterium]